MNDTKIEITQEDIDMGKYIYSILLRQTTVLMSWGFESPIVIKLGLRFKVNGFKHRGWIEIRYNEGADLFDISIFDKDNTLIDSVASIYFDELVDTMDLKVERVDNYVERVNQEYNIETYEAKDI